MFDKLTDLFLGAAYAASNHGVYTSVTTSFIVSAWALEFTLNVFVTGAIVARLWQMGQTMASLTATPTNRFASSIYLIVESGGIIAIASTVVVALFASSSPASVTGFDVVCQVLVWVHLLIRSVACTELLCFGRC